MGGDNVLVLPATLGCKPKTTVSKQGAHIGVAEGSCNWTLRRCRCSQGERSVRRADISAHPTLFESRRALRSHHVLNHSAASSVPL
ncbi:hypothetical protein BN2475_630029 [Paraburkholderia ribeironis]|uniref:Uncharacterized protein n=1 Tax=Paraburkholderia ribeironis TaxID=1247936 RepID=A0A1N7SFR6_9BURK|nr:hypothetical protein BN2475_630029 [Paraburkholderia ribeironis]